MRFIKLRKASTADARRFNMNQTPQVNGSRIRRVLFWGCMFSGKSTELQRTFRCLKHSGLKAQLFTPIQNSRERDQLVRTHDGNELSAITVASLREILDCVDSEQLDAVLLDEAQFVDYLAPLCEQLYVRKVHLYMAALNQKFDGSAWPNITAILHGCEIKQLWGVCKSCKNWTASHSFLYGTGKVDEHGNIIGGEELYQAQCTQCWREKTNYTEFLNAL
jgi:thymidine kinase